MIRFNGYELWEPVGMKGVGYSGGMVMGMVVKEMGLVGMKDRRVVEW